MRGLDLSIAQRLGLGFGAIFLLLAVQAGIVYDRNLQIDVLDHQVTDVVAPRALAAVDLQDQILLQGIALRGYALSHDVSFRQRFQEAQQRAIAALSTLGSLPRDTESQALYGQIVPAAESYRQNANHFAALVQQGGGEDTLAAAEADLTAARTGLLDLTQSLIDLQFRAQARMLAEVNAARAQVLQTLVVLSGLVLLLGAAVALFTTHAVRQPARRLVQAARALETGDYAPALALAPPPSPAELAPGGRNELRLLARAFARMAAGLQRRERRLAANREVAAALAATIEVERAAIEALRAVMDYTNCAFGAVYLFDAPTSGLQRVAAYALEGGPERIELGEGIPGQAAADRRPAIVRDIPADTPFQVRFGFDQVPPRTVAAFPLLVEDALVGVLLLGSLHPLTDEALGFIEHSCHSLAISLQNALNHQQVSRLAADLHEKNDQLEAQNEELQAQGEELQAQSEELRSQNEELQAQGEELQALNDELHRHREELLESDRLKDEFLSIAAHELKTPVTSLKGFAQLLQRHAHRRPDLQEFSRHFAAIDQQADALAARVSRLLDASRAKMGRLEINPAPVDLSLLVAQQVEQARARSDKHELIVETQSDDLVGLWDGSRLEQVVGNLIDNALRYSPKGGEVRVTISAEEGEARLAVRDTGIGIPPEALARLFTPYFRHESARRVTADGMGIGLFISREIVAAHGGRIWVESTPGEGACFTVALPLAVRSLPVLPG